MLNSVGACLTPLIAVKGSEYNHSERVHAIMKLQCHRYESRRRAISKTHNDYVECFGEVDKGHVDVHILFLTFLLELSRCKDHVYCSSVFPVSTPTFWYKSSLIKIHIQAILYIGFFACTVPAIDKRKMARWLSKTLGYPFRLYRWIMDASLNSCEIASFHCWPLSFIDLGRKSIRAWGFARRNIPNLFLCFCDGGGIYQTEHCTSVSVC